MFLSGFAMWSVMMAAMMLPGAALAQGWLERAALLSDMMALRSSIAAGIVIIAVGLYQLTPAKRRALLECRVRPADPPASFPESVMAGLRYGGACLGSSAPLMALLFVAGVMSYAWMVAIALWILAEKWLPWGAGLPRYVGVALVAWGGVLLAGRVT